MADEPGSGAQATPAAERTAEELGVDLSQVSGTGSGGRITVRDVRSGARVR
jgi:pyruvate dehydrogenase E2 component (dihydrolipoyllysine-residue acetyltransferase)